MQIIDFFERVYIVNLPERADRRMEMDAELGQYGLRVDGDKIRYFRAIKPDSAGEFPSRGARGCFMSHLEILRDAARDQLSNILVMEDDLKIDERLLQPHPGMLARLNQPDWDFAYFGHVLESLPQSDAPEWIEYLEPIATTHFYALNQKMIPRLGEYLETCLERPVGHPEGGPMHVDGAYSLFRSKRPGIVTLVANPSLGGQRSSRSDIFPNKWYDRTPGFRGFAGVARKAKNWMRKT